MQIYYIGRIEPINTLKTLCIKIPWSWRTRLFRWSGVSDGEFFGSEKRPVQFPEYQKSVWWEPNLLGSQDGITGPQRLPNQDWWDKEREGALTTSLLITSRLFPSPAPLFSVALLFFRSISLSWKPFPTHRMPLPTLPRPWWSSWLPGAECLKTGAGKQLKSSWERYQIAWQEEHPAVSLLSPMVLLDSKRCSNQRRSSLHLSV